MDPSLHPASLPLERLDRAARVRLARAGRIRAVEPRRPLHLPSGSSGGILVVVEGAVALRVGAGNGSLALLVVRFAGDLLGDAEEPLDPFAPHLGQPRWFEVQALVPSRLLVIHAEAFRHVIAEHPDVHHWYLRALAGRSRLSEHRLAEWMLLSPTNRVEAALRDLAVRRPGGDGRHVELPVTQELLAQMVGVTRESANRSIQALIRRGRLRRSGRSYVIPGECPEPA